MSIPLLTPQSIKDGRREDLDRGQRRALALATEEDSLVRSLNLTRDAVNEQKGELALELQDFEDGVNARKKILAEEITHMEHQRDAIMAPLEERRKAVEQREVGVLDRENAVTEREGKVRQREEAAKQREEALPAAEEAIKSRELAIQPKEDDQTKREESIKAAWVALEREQRKQADLERTHAEANENRRAKNDADEKANAIERQRIIEKDIEHANKDREIADRYKQLEITARELGILPTP